MLLDALIIVFIFVIGLQIPSFFRFSQKDLGRLRFLWVYHLIFGYAYYSSVVAQGGSDSLKYWSEAKKITSQQALLSLVENKGTQVMYAVNYIPSGILGLDLLTGTIVYSLIGFIGLINGIIGLLLRTLIVIHGLLFWRWILFLLLKMVRKLLASVPGQGLIQLIR